MKLFDTDSEQDLRDEIMRSASWRGGSHEDLAAILTSDIKSLRDFVRTQFKCIPKAAWNPALTDLVARLVEPCLAVKDGCWSGQVMLNAKTFAKKMTSSSLSTIEDFNLKVASRVASGALNEHPLLQGILTVVLEPTIPTSPRHQYVEVPAP